MSYLEPSAAIEPALLMLRIEAELAGCRGILAKLEYAVETLLQSGTIAADDPIHIMEMQNIDLLDQILADIMLCLQDIAASDALANGAPLRLGQVLRRTRLAALRNRLAGFSHHVDSGDGVELF